MKRSAMKYSPIPARTVSTIVAGVRIDRFMG